MKNKKIKKKKLNIVRTLVFILFIYIIICLGFYIYKKPVRHYEIIGNNLISDVEILRELNLENYPSFISVNTRRLSKKLKNNPLIKEAKVSYFWNFYIKIEIEENKPLFVVKTNNKICLSDGTLIDYRDDFIGLPTLLNVTPDNIMKMLANGLNEVDDGILYTISEITYRPSYNSKNKIIDENRFLLSMNDKNLVYITAKNAKILNRYLDIIATKQLTSNGTFFLDGDDYKAAVKMFSTTKTTKKEE